MSGEQGMLDATVAGQSIAQTWSLPLKAEGLTMVQFSGYSALQKSPNCQCLRKQPSLSIWKNLPEKMPFQRSRRIPMQERR